MPKSGFRYHRARSLADLIGAPDGRLKQRTKGTAGLRKIFWEPYGGRTKNNSGQQSRLNHRRPYSDNGNRRRRRELSIAIVVRGIDRVRVRQYQLYSLIDDLGDARNAFGQDHERLSFIFRADKAPEMHLAILHDHIVAGEIGPRLFFPEGEGR